MLGRVRVLFGRGHEECFGVCVCGWDDGGDAIFMKVVLDSRLRWSRGRSRVRERNDMLNSYPSVSWSPLFNVLLLPDIPRTSGLRRACN